MTDTTTHTLQDAQPTKDMPAPADKKFVSWGWRVHNEVTYRGINWLLNSTLGVAFTYWSKVTESGKNIFTKPVTAGFEKTITFIANSLKFTLKEKTLKSGAAYGTDFVGIMIGGFSVIPLVMMMENKAIKKNIVRWLDTIIYGKKAVETDPKFEESYKNIDKEPKKKFWVGMFTRLVSLAPLLALTIITPTQIWLKNNLYDRIGDRTRALAEKVGIRPIKMMTQTIEVDGSPKIKWNHLHYLIGFDFGLTFFYAFIHEITYKALAAFGIKQSKSSDKRVHDIPQAAAKTPAQESAPDMSVPEASAGTKSFTQHYGAAKPPMEKSEGFIQSVDKSRLGTAQQAFS